MANSSASFAFRGTFIHAPHFGNVECLEDHVCVVSSKEQGGNILALVSATASLSVLAEHGVLESTVYNIPVRVRIFDIATEQSIRPVVHFSQVDQLRCLACFQRVCACRMGVSCARDLWTFTVMRLRWASMRNFGRTIEQHHCSIFIFIDINTALPRVSTAACMRLSCALNAV